MQWAECGVSVVFFSSSLYYKFIWATARYTQDWAHNSRREWCILMWNLNALSTYIAHRTLYVPINRWAFNPMMIAASKLWLVGSCLFALLSNVLWIAAKIQMNQHTINSHLGRLDPRSPQLNCVNYARYAFAVHFACAMKLKIVKKSYIENIRNGIIKFSRKIAIWITRSGALRSWFYYFAPNEIRHSNSNGFTDSQR